MGEYSEIMERLFHLVGLLPLFLFMLAAGSAQAGLFAGDDPNKTLQGALAKTALSYDGYDLAPEELKSFYAARHDQAAWDSTPAVLTAFLDSIRSYIDFHGLNVEDYPLDILPQAAADDSADGKVAFDLLMTTTLLRLAHDLHGDAVDLSQLYVGWSFHRAPQDIETGLANAVNDNKVSAFIAGLAPLNPAYTQLTQAVKTYRALKAWAPIATGPTLRAGDHDPRIAPIRARLVAENYLPAESLPATLEETYDPALQEAVKTYQKRNGLKDDGTLGPRTVAFMNIPLATRVDQILANMERWRHMPESFPSRYAIVNIADATIDVIEDGKPLYHSLVVIGRPDRKTPFIQSTIRSVIFNPSWHVPTKIARKDILPKLRKDPHYLEKLGFVINGSANDPYGAAVNWDKVKETAFNFQLRQSPGDMNSLGRLKFDFDNDFSVYLHGTPHQELFAKAERDLSSGCIRLSDPVAFAEIVLEKNDGSWTPDRIHDEIDKSKTRWLGITEPLPLFIVYNTVFEDESGAVNFRNDIYDYDRFLMETLRETEATAPVEETTPEKP